MPHRIFRRIAAVSIALFTLMVIATGSLLAVAVVSPWPGVLLITWAFAGNDSVSEAALAKYVPRGVQTRQDLPYGEGPDEVLNISYPPEPQGELPLVVWVHGGGWVGGSKNGVANYLRILASHGYAVAGIDYSKAPGATYPTPTRQTLLALGYLTNNSDALGIDKTRIVLAGDSAGAQIAGQASMVISDNAYAERLGLHSTIPAETLRGVVLVSGAFDMSGIDLDGPYGWFIQTVLWAYSGVKDFMDDEQFVLASITPNVSAAFPPSFISSGDADPLEPQAKTLASQLDSLEVETSTLFFEAGRGLNHEYQFDLDLPAGQEALTRLLQFLDERIVPQGTRSQFEG